MSHDTALNHARHDAVLLCGGNIGPDVTMGTDDEGQLLDSKMISMLSAAERRPSDLASECLSPRQDAILHGAVIAPIRPIGQQLQSSEIVEQELHLLRRRCRYVYGNRLVWRIWLRQLGV